MDRPAPVRLPFLLVLLLAACLLGLVVHVYAESLDPSGAENAGAGSAGHADDTFVLFSPVFLASFGILTGNLLAAPLRRATFYQPPLLPPPNP